MLPSMMRTPRLRHLPIALTALLALAGAAQAQEVERPAQAESFAWQLQGRIAPATKRAAAIDLDLFDVPEKTIAELRDAGRYVICYVSVGSWESWRPDKNDFPEAAIGNPYFGWKGERWLDISKLDLVGPPLAARLDLARDKGCDAIEPDNLDGWQYRERGGTGFDLTKQHAVALIRWLVAEGHARGLAVGLKNVPELVRSVGLKTDFAITEDCAEWRFCGDYRPMLDKGLAVFHVHYTDTEVDFGEICRKADPRETHILKKRSLKAWVRHCPGEQP
jgi:hypothetical protein